MFLYSALMITVHFVIVVGIIRACVESRRLFSQSDKGFKVSVIIPARNEAENLPSLFASLERELVPGVEIILADDRSDDNTLPLMRDFASRHDNVKVISNSQMPPPTMNPKQYMLYLAEKHASGEILLFTDADCTVPEKWISAVCRYFADDRVGLVFSSVVTTPGTGFVRRYQTFDHLLRFFYTVGAVGLGNPSGGFGNNLAVRRKALEEAGGFDGIGFSLTEDAQLIASVRNTGKWKVAVCPFRDALVHASPQKRLFDVLRQETRWSAGAIFGSDRKTAFMYVFMLMLTFVSTVSFFLIPFYGPALIQYLTSVFVMVLISSAGAFWLRPGPEFVLWILPCSFIGTFFYGLTFFSAFFVSSVNWRGTALKKQKNI